VRRRAADLCRGALDAGELAVVDEHEIRRRHAEAARDVADARLDALDSAGLGEDLPEAMLLGLVLAQDDHARPVAHRVAQDVGRLEDRRRAPARSACRRSASRAGRLCRSSRGCAAASRLRSIMPLRARPTARAGLGAILMRSGSISTHTAVGESSEAAARRARSRSRRRRGTARGARALHRALVSGIEAAQRVDLAVEQLDAQRQLAREREDVDDVAAQADLARVLASGTRA
jgi:hypothetical protein